MLRTDIFVTLSPESTQSFTQNALALLWTLLKAPTRLKASMILSINIHSNLRIMTCMGRLYQFAVLEASLKRFWSKVCQSWDSFQSPCMDFPSGNRATYKALLCVQYAVARGPSLELDSCVCHNDTKFPVLTAHEPWLQVICIT